MRSYWWYWAEKGHGEILILERAFWLQRGLAQREWHQKDNLEDSKWSTVEELRTKIHFPCALNLPFSPFSSIFPHSPRYIYLFCPRSLDEWSTGEKPAHLPARYTLKSSASTSPIQGLGPQGFWLLMEGEVEGMMLWLLFKIPSEVQRSEKSTLTPSQTN